MKTAADRTVELFTQCCTHCGSTEHPPEQCNVRPETKRERQLSLFTPSNQPKKS